MDPNLVKICDVHVDLIQQGKTRKPVRQAKDYLNYILGHDSERIQNELKKFKQHLKNKKNK